MIEHDFYETAAKQCIDKAIAGGDMAVCYAFVSLFMALVSIFLFNKVIKDIRKMESFFSDRPIEVMCLGIITVLISLMFGMYAISAKYQCVEAQKRPEMFVIKKLGGSYERKSRTPEY